MTIGEEGEEASLGERKTMDGKQHVWEAPSGNLLSGI